MTGAVELRFASSRLEKHGMKNAFAGKQPRRSSVVFQRARRVCCAFNECPVSFDPSGFHQKKKKVSL